ncbi:phage tail terminator protein [Pseudoalteromonas denitrificans]|uniref:Uncharacterized protein n=1 Tax=Pseudoalteromonas denitrificans DSM 6059 TaxID=1123010 RepID=A0A1I1T916_9GAMM|nr:hypothetical protein [Pseudoalteromonas denitrificans]SFD55127.1 hypothetical protein SAMN02745724_04826 [Pseudoalteromonas denitrificans DSM 6059]
MFNFDLNKIDKVLRDAKIARVGFAADFNAARKKGVQSPTLYVLPLDDNYDDAGSVTGEDEYIVTEIFAVMIVLPCLAGNKNSDTEIKTLRSKVKQAIAGCAFSPWQPIKLHRGRTVELSRETNNLIYQCQFKVVGNVTVKTKVIEG